jgi:SpoVK/Ycf46/Vps4 family AAA+-type ATPase
LWRELLGLKKTESLLELITPRRTFSDVILAPETREQLYEALTQIEKHRLIYSQWGLGERHPTARGLAFNFAGPPGTGKTICAEAVAFTLGKKLLRVRYSELQSMWVGETGKNLHSVFREAATQDAILFFDEADSIASRRFSDASSGHERELNLVVNILLNELEEHQGVVIFATNMAANFDPAFERRIRAHILFRIPGPAERERIWKVQIHPEKTPLATDVDFRALAERFVVSGGDIRNAVLRAAQIAAGQEGPDETKRIQQKHLIQAMERVLAAKQVMEQTIQAATAPWEAAAEAVSRRLEEFATDLDACRTELAELAGDQSMLATRCEALEAATAAARGDLERIAGEQATAIQAWRGEQESVLARLTEQWAAQQALLARVTLLPWPKTVTVAVLLALFALGLAVGRLL